MLPETKTMTFIFCQFSQDHVSHQSLWKLLCRLGNIEVNATDLLFLLYIWIFANQYESSKNGKKIEN